MAGNNFGVFGEREQARLDGVENLVVVAAGQVGPSDAAGKEGIAREDHFQGFEVKADGALGVAGRVNDVGGVVFEAYAAAIGKGLVGRGGLRGGNADPRGLFGHDLHEGKIVFVEEDGGPGKGLELEGSADVVDVGVGDENLLQSQAVGFEALVNAGGLVAGVDDDSLAGLLVAEKSAIALQRADGKGLQDHGFIVERRRCRSGLKAEEAGREGLPRYLRSGDEAYLPGFAGADEDAGFTSSSTEREWPERTKRTVSESEVIMKMIADQVVSRVSTFAAARGPKAVCEP